MSYRSPQDGTPLLFSSVLKNIASPSLAVKKLVYIYLLQNAESEPDTALLAINTIQKSLSAPDPNLRALALRVMSGIRVPVISQIVALGIKRGIADMSPLVRRAAALAIPKCWRLDPNTAPLLLECLSTLLGDRQYFVAGAAVMAFTQVCPDRIDLMHKHYHSLVRKLVDMDEWGQLATLQLMTVYARRCFPNHEAPSSFTDQDQTVDFYDTKTTPASISTSIDPDLALLLTSVQPLLQSRNSAVIVAVTRLYLALAPSTHLPLTAGPLVSLLRGNTASHALALHSIAAVALQIPIAFTPYLTHFLLHANDTAASQHLKLELLALLFPHAPPRAQSLILAELAHFCAPGHADPRLAPAAIRALGRCAASTPPSSPEARRCLARLLDLVADADAGPSAAELVAEALTVVRHLVQADPAAHAGTVVRLAKRLDATRSPAARATIIWLVGEFVGLNAGDNVAADVLRILAKGFAEEAEQAKLQIVLLAAKVYVHHLNAAQARAEVGAHEGGGGYKAIDTAEPVIADPSDDPTHTAQADSQRSHPTNMPQPNHPIALLWDYILLLARYDTSYDLRDRARVYKSLLSVPTSTQLATLLLLAPKPAPKAPSPSESRRTFTLGTASQALGVEGAGINGLPGYESLPDWVREGRQPDASLRADEASTGYVGSREVVMSAAERLDAQAGGIVSMMGSRQAKTNGLGGARAEKSLDDWLAESDEEEASSEEDEDEEEDGEEEEETEEEESESTEEESEDEEQDDDSPDEDDANHGEKAQLMK